MLLTSDTMTKSYWKDLVKKFENWYKTKDHTELKTTFEEFNSVSTESFVDFFKTYIYPTLAKMNITSIQKAKYLWSILNRDQFKAIIDSVK